MPTDPKRYTVVLAVAEALRAIDAAHGYFHTVKPTSVTTKMDSDLWTVPESALPYFVVMPDSFENDDYLRGMQVKVDFPLLIVGRMDAPRGSVGTEKLQTWEQLFADIERAVTHHPVTGVEDVTLGGQVVDVTVTSRQAGIDVGSSPQVHVRIGVTAQYFRRFGAA